MKHLFTILFFLVAILMMQAQTSVLWGTTSAGGIGGPGADATIRSNGTIFSFDLNTNILTVQHNFSDTISSVPVGALTLANNGLLYGMGVAEDGNDTGSVFSFDRATGITTYVHRFGISNTGVCCDGIFPHGSLIQATNGLLYGTTTSGGSLGGGTIFDLDITTGKETVVHNFDFNLFQDGVPTSSSLLQASNGLLYGTTEYGGRNGVGEIFSYNTLTDSLLVVCDSIREFSIPVPYFYTAALIQVNDSLLYGNTYAGGLYDSGMIFSYNIVTGTLRDVHDFGTGNDGSISESTLLKANNGLLYGMTTQGGQYGGGVIYSYNIFSGIETVLHSFGSGTDGRSPVASLIQANNGLLYATTYGGGAYNFGTIISYNIATQTETVVHSFDSINGALPWGSLLEIIDTPSSIHNLSSALQFQLYPNPTTEHLFIKTEGLQPETISFYDVNGRMIYVTAFKTEIDIRELSSGVYLVALRDNNGFSIFRKLVLE